jgi:hypothetical protein
MRFLSRPPIVGLAVAVLLTGAGTAAAGGRLDLFDGRPERSGADPFDVRRVDLAAASAAASELGFALPTLHEPPRGVTGEPAYVVAAPGVAAVWGGPDEVPRLVVGRATIPDDFPVMSVIASLIGDSPGTVLDAPDVALSAVIWVEHDVTTIVAGTFDHDEIAAIAGSVG